MSRLQLIRTLLLAVTAAACSRDNGLKADTSNGSVATAPADTTPPPILAATRWRLAEIQSMSDDQGTTRPDDPSKYTVAFDSEGGFLVMQLDCKRATGQYKDQPASDKRSGSVTIGPLNVTPMQCGATSLSDRVARDMGYVRGYRFANGKLALSLMADGGIYIWDRDRAPR